MKAMTKRKMTKAQARVAIARDVIKQVKAKELVTGIFGYLRFTKPTRGTDLEYLYEEVGRDLRDVLNERVKQCGVCAKGALFIAHVKRFDRVKLSRSHVYRADDKDMCQPLLANFTQAQLNLIEHVYERGCRYVELRSRKAVAFWVRFRDSHRTPLLIAIMRNIIRNKGTFRP